MKLLLLVLTNFQGIRNITLEFCGKSASIYGDNSVGKTTVYNALTWLLFDKASNGAKGFTPKTRGKDGELHNLEHSVKGEFETDDGSRVTLKKTLKEVYKKKRGSAKEEFTGHSVDYEIDGVPTKEKEYTSRVLDFCGGDEKRIKILTMPDYFSEQLSWEERRKILIELVGDCSQEDVIASTYELEELPSVLKMPGNTNRMYSVDEFRAIATARRSEINKQLQEIPARIDEAERMMSGSDCGVQGIESAIKELDDRYNELLKKKTAVMSSGGFEYEIGIKRCQLKIAGIEAEYQARASEKSKARAEEVMKLQGEFFQKRGEINAIDSELNPLVEKTERMISLRKELVEQYRACLGKHWDDSSRVCPTCGQELPAEKIAELKKSFEDSKASELQEINDRGKREASKAEIDSNNARIEELRKQREELVSQCDSLESRVDELRKTGDSEDYKKLEEYISLEAEIRDLEKQKSESEAGVAESLKSLDDEMKSIREKRDEQEKKKAAIAVGESAKKRIEELEQLEKDLGGVYEELERGLYLCDVYTKTLVSMLTSKINDRFKSVRFRLFQNQINGGVKDDCEVMIPSAEGNLVPYGMANNAARLNAGLEIIDTLSEFWGIRMPVVLDNAEAVTHPYKMKAGQFIKLIVSEPDKVLRMELEA